MEYKDEKRNISFMVPDKVTVRQQLAYYSGAALASGEDLFERLWFGARAVIQNWQCQTVPDIGVDLDDLTDPAATDCLIWAAMRVREHMEKLEAVPKN